MKRKVLSLVTAFCLIIACAFSMTACGSSTEQDEPMTKAELASTIKTVAKKAWEALGAGDPTVENPETQITAIRLANATLPDEIKEVTGNDATEIKAVAAGNIAIVNMIGDYYENENFVVSDKTVSFVVNMLDPNSGEVYASSTLGILPKVDKKNGRVVIEMSIESDSMQALGVKEAKAYYIFDIGFDFENAKTTDCYILNVQDNVSNNDSEYFEANEMKITSDGKYYSLHASNASQDGTLEGCTEEYKTAALAKLADYFERKKDGSVLTGDFDEEFNKYSDNANRAYQAVHDNAR